MVRIFERGKATPLKFFVQAKATDNISRFQRGKTDIIRLPLKKEHLLQWKGFNDPVILTLWDSHSELIYWVCAQNAIDKLSKQLYPASSKQKIIPVPVPPENVLDGDGVNRIHRISRTYHRRVLREKERTENLKAAIEQKFGVKIDCGSDVILILEQGKEPDVVLSGKTLAQLKRTATERKMPLQTAFNLAVDLCLEEFAEFEKSGFYPIWNEKTGRREVSKLTGKQLADYLQRELEHMDESQ